MYCKLPQRSFFGGIQDAIICFWDLLTFRSSQNRDFFLILWIFLRIVFHEYEFILMILKTMVDFYHRMNSQFYIFSGKKVDFFDVAMVFCYHDCSNLLWENIVLLIEKNFWNWRLNFLRSLEQFLQKVKGESNLW